MSNKQVLCEYCREKMPFTIETEKIDGSIKGEKYTYIGKKAYCTKCGSEIYVSDVMDYNLKALYDEFREKNNLISLEKILEIPEKYGIGKRPLSLLLGWGELTFSRYCDGDLPTNQYSEILKKIYEDPCYYLDTLEKNKDNLKSDISYSKSRKAVEKLMSNINATSKDKIDLVISYLLSYCEDITPLALQKALYYCQGFNYAFSNTFLFNDECEAWVHGPVYPRIYERYSNYGYKPIVRDSGDIDSAFTSFERSIMDSIIRNICCYSGKVLEVFTHNEKPWLNARGNLSSFELSNRVISNEEIGKYFSEVKKLYKMINPSDIKEYSNTMFLRIY